MTHVIEDLRRLDASEIGSGERQPNASWHQVTCTCGWTRKYVSQYRARVMHDRHADTLLEIASR
jgi:hypothetical protein